MKQVMRESFVLRTEYYEQAAKARDLLGWSYTCVHARREDFKIHYPMMVLSPDMLVDNIIDQLLPGESVYFATDESDKVFWNQVKSRLNHFNIFTLRDLKPQIANDTPAYKLPIIENILCSKARLFFGTRLSTFTSLIHRLRGFDPEVENKE
eukprot:gene4004-2253_t